MDFSFFWASSKDYKSGGSKGPVVRLRDGYTANLLITDAHSRMLFTFPTLGKDPPIEIVDHFLTLHKQQEGPYRAVQVDQGGELWKSLDFRSLVHQHSYIIEPTGSDAV